MAFDIKAAKERAAALGIVTAADRAAAATPAPPVLPAVPVADEFSDLGLEDVHEAGTYTRSTEDLQIDSIIDGLSVMEAYSKFVPKDPRTRRAGSNEFLVSCPNPAHPDKTPSCSVNTEKQLWTCYSCGKSGDAIDLAALNLGYTDDSYKQGKNFVELRKSIAGKLGWVPSHKNLAGQQVYTQQQAEQQIEQQPVIITAFGLAPAVPPPPPSISALNTLDPAAMLKKMSAQGQVVTGSTVPVTSITAAPSYIEPRSTDRGDQVDEDANVKYPSIGDWETKLKTSDSNFIYEYVKALSHLPYPVEYDFWNALIAVGAILGRDVYMRDSPIVYANLYVCTVGPTGGGKSQAGRHLETLLEENLAYEDTVGNKGMKIIPTPNSEVFLINEFRKEIENPTNPKLPPEILPVKGFVSFSELSGLMARTKDTKGGKFESVTMELFDNRRTVSTGSMGGGKVSAPDTFCVMTTTTQLKSVKSLMSVANAASGFLNRWCFAMGPTVQRDFFSSAIEPDMTRAKHEFDQIKAFYALNPGGIGFTPDGHARAKLLWSSRGYPTMTNDGTELMKRLDLLFKKLLIIFAANQRLKMITEEVVDQTFEFFDYIVQSYKMVGARIGITVQGDMENKVMNCLISYEKNHPGSQPTATNLSKNLSAQITMKDLRAILADLISLGVVELIVPVRTPGQRGTLGDRYRYVG